MAARIPTRLSAREGRHFALTVGAAFAALGAVLWWRGLPVGALLAAALGGLLALAGLAVPGRLGPVYRTWMGLALAISKVTTPILMGIVYFLVITPTGLLRRAFGHNSLVTSKGAPSFWADREPTGRRSDLQRQF